MTIELRCGRWQDVLADVECDALICDPPYSERTEKGFRTGADVSSAVGMGYDPIDEAWCHSFVESWSPRCSGWMFLFGDHISIRWFEAALEASGRYVFPPLAIVKIGAAPRMAGDGPASQCEWAICARPRQARFMGAGSLPGWYAMQTVRAQHGYTGIRGTKSPELMRAIVRDYSQPGDLICDPCSGSGTTLRAARAEHRHAIGAEVDPETYAKAMQILDHGVGVSASQLPLLASGGER